MSGFGAEIIAIDDTDGVGWAESATTIGEVNFSSVTTFVSGVLRELGSRKMSLLHIQVHGSPSSMWFGPTEISMASFSSYRSQFARLVGKFETGAWVDLRACNVGQCLPLLRTFHRLWSVGIVAGRGSQNNLFDANFGRYQIVFPDGHEDTSFFVPPWVEYDVGRRLIRSISSRL